MLDYKERCTAMGVNDLLPVQGVGISAIDTIKYTCIEIKVM